ncbi:uncharacterized protein [Henckelia pumila]|uniref:uncharacterized protein n=1 Tax=Henckelia pumila TaxID=405737 RepID=UPI003C6E4E78
MLPYYEEWTGYHHETMQTKADSNRSVGEGQKGQLVLLNFPFQEPGDRVPYKRPKNNTTQPNPITNRNLMCFDPHTHWWRSLNLFPHKLQFTARNHNERPDQNDIFSSQPFSFSATAMNLSSWLGRSRPSKKAYDSKYLALSKSHRVQGISLSELRSMCDECIAEVKHEIVNEGSDTEFQPEMPVGGGSTHINADKNATLRNLAEIALEFYNDTKSKKFKLVKVCKVNTIAFRYSGVTFRAREDGSEESPLFRAVVFLCKPLFCEIKVPYSSHSRPQFIYFNCNYFLVE